MSVKQQEKSPVGPDLPFTTFYRYTIPSDEGGHHCQAVSPILVLIISKKNDVKISVHTSRDFRTSLGKFTHIGHHSNSSMGGGVPQSSTNDTPIILSELWNLLLLECCGNTTTTLQ